MKVQQYQKIYHWFQGHPRAFALLCWCNRVCPMVPFVMYAVLLGYHVRLFCLAGFAQQSFWVAAQGLVMALVVPALVFVLGTFLRAVLNKPRPYEQPGFVALISKNKLGHAFPSRHMFSASVIAVAWWMVLPAMGVCLVLVALGIGVLRVLSGVHSVQDVFAGLLFGVGLGALLFALLPQLCCMLK